MFYLFLVEHMKDMRCRAVPYQVGVTLTLMRVYMAIGVVGIGFGFF